jgi:methyl coenzyme M reductase subunit D
MPGDVFLTGAFRNGGKKEEAMFIKIKIQMQITVNRKTIIVNEMIQNIQNLFNQFLNSDYVMHIGEMQKMRISVLDIIQFLLRSIL